MRRSFAALLPVLLCLPAFAAETEGEGGRVEARLEWFYGTREMSPAAGYPNLHIYAEARAQAALETQRRIAAQKTSLRAPSIWTNIGPAPIATGATAGPDAGRVTGLAIHPTNPSIIYLGAAAGGFWKTVDGGTSWINLFETMPTQSIGAVGLAASDPNVIWVGTGDYNAGTYFGMGMFRSTDAGATWEPRNGTGATYMKLTQVASVLVHPTNPDDVIVGGPNYRDATGTGEGGVYRTTDGGLNWTFVYPDRRTNEVVRDPSNPNILYAARRGSSSGPTYGVIKSTDAGATWVDSGTGLNMTPPYSRTEIAICQSNPATLYFLVENSDLYRSTNGAATWTLVNGNACDGQCSYNLAMKVATNDPNTVYIGALKAFKSTNGGTTFGALSAYGVKLHPDVQHLESHPTDPNTTFWGTDGGLWKTTDTGTTFTNLNGNLNLTQFYHAAVHPTLDTIALGGAQDNGHARYSGSPVWAYTAFTGDGMYTGIHPVDPNYWFAGTYPNPNTTIRRSTNGGTNWATCSNDINEPSGWVCPFVFDPVNPDVMYAGTKHLWRSTDKGSNWAKVNATTPLFASFARAIAIAPSNNQIIYVGAGTAMHRTTDYGATWTNITAGLPNRSFQDVAVDPANPNHVYVTATAFWATNLYVSTDGGATWAGINAGLPPVPANTVLVVPNPYRIYVGTDVGVFVGLSDAGPFVPDMNGFAQGVPVTELMYNAVTNTITASTYGRGAWKKDAGGFSAATVLVGKGAASAATYDSRVNGYRSDGQLLQQVDFLAYTGTGFGTNVTGSDITGEGVGEILTGQGPGSTHPPVGKAFTNTGLPITGATFTAYGGTGFGLNISGGDLDGDGIDEIATGPGEGVVYGPQVRGWNYDNAGTMTTIAKINFYAYGTLKYGTNVAVHSFDVDATWKEILSGAGPGDVFGPHVRGWNYDGTAITAVAKVNFFAYSTLKFGVNVSGGDVDRDGSEEIITGAGPGAAFGALVRGFNVDAGTATAMSKINYLAYATGGYGVNVAGGDVDGDGFGEIATGQGPDPTAPAVVKGWNFDGSTIAEITAMSRTAWPGLTYGLTVGAGPLGY